METFAMHTKQTFNNQSYYDPYKNETFSKSQEITNSAQLHLNTLRTTEEHIRQGIVLYKKMLNGWMAFFFRTFI